LRDRPELPFITFLMYASSSFIVLQYGLGKK
jgi:hypothetical protein